MDIIRVTIQHVRDTTHYTSVIDSGWTVDTVVPDDWSDDEIIERMDELNREIVRMEGVS